MKNNYFKWSVFVCLSLVTLVSTAQINCGTDEYLKKQIAEDPSILKKQAEMEKRTQKLIALNRLKEARNDTVRDTLVIPIVFHIIHQYGPENISDQQIESAVRILNEDFQLRNSDVSDILPEFQAIKGDTKLKFVLATIDPYGNCTNGIERIPSLETYYVNQDLNRGRFGIWDHTKYLNIWVTKLLPGTAAGISTFPFTAQGPFSKHDGISMLHSYVGDIGTSNPGGARALTHEVGHYYNLFHIWGNTEVGTFCGDDGVADTPETKGFSPNSIPCQSRQIICDTITNSIVENHQNYMDYAYCQVMFTNDQVDRMRAALNDSASYRYNLYKDANLAATGINGTTDRVCVPLADFYTDKMVACRNTPVNFHDNSTRNKVTSRTWTFQDGNPSTSNLPDQAVRFSSGGWKNVTLSVVGTGGTDSKTEVRAVFISTDTIANTVPYAQEFSDNSIFGDSWLVKNFESNVTKFAQTTTTGFHDNTSVKLNAAKSAGGRTITDGIGDIDQLYSPAFNLSGKKDWAITFKMAAATKTTSPASMLDSLTFEYSVNCGNSWALLRKFTKQQLYTAGFHSEDFVPAAKSDWNDIVILVTDAVAKDNIRFRYNYVSSAKSNNIYIDDFQIVPTSSVNELLANNLSVSLYPNPVTQESVVNFYLASSSEVSLSISDVTGKLLNVRNLGKLNEGEQTINLNNQTNSLSNGIYFLTVKVGTNLVTKKLIVG